MKLYNPLRSTPAPPGFGGSRVVPEVTASIPSLVWFSWLTSFLSVGFSRPLEKEESVTASVTDEVEINFYSRCAPEKRHNHGAFVNIFMTTNLRKYAKGTLEDESLFKAIFYTFNTTICISGILRLCADTLRTTTPLLNKVILNWLVESFAYVKTSADERAALGLNPPRGIGYGVGLAFALFAMQAVCMQLGMSLRTAIIGNVFRKSLRLSCKGRAEHSVGKITTHISTDASKLEESCATVHLLWVSPIQLIIGIGLVIGTLGYSALVGFGVIIIGIPVMLVFSMFMMAQFDKGVKITDQRVRLTTEALQGIRLIKYYAWEGFYSERIGKLRKMELKTVRKVVVYASCMVSLVEFVPLLGTVLSFITYSLTGHDLNVAIIFTALQLFTTIKNPLLLIPFALKDFTDSIVAIRRIKTFLLAEELEEPYRLDFRHEAAVDVVGSFVWDVASGINEEKKARNDPEKKKEMKEKKAKKVKDNEPPALPVVASSDPPVDTEEKKDPFELKNVKLTIPKGSFVAIVGRSSLLQAIIGEMRRVSGEVVLGGSIAYVPQMAWIKNATLRNNIIFGQPENQERLDEVIHACSLEQDLKILPRGEATEIGEKGINLSGAFARVSLARAAYSSADIAILDDPLSAVDSHVGNAIVENCLLAGPFANRTRILVTHALHVLDKVDHIYVMENGEIVEQGSYANLMSNQGSFARLIEEYGNKASDPADKASSPNEKDSKSKALEAGIKSLDDPLMQAEDREVGAVAWNIYSQYLSLSGGFAAVLLITLLLTIEQGFQVATTLFLGFWTAGSIHGFKQGDYMAVYSALGRNIHYFSPFVHNIIFSSPTSRYVGLDASFKLFQGALRGVLRSSMAFFDTTPIGRVISRLSKDVEALDLQISFGVYQMLSTASSIFGTVALVFYTFPLLGIIFPPLAIMYYLFGIYYRRSSVEIKRLDSLLRSGLYAAYSESLTGLSTIRAYGLPRTFIKATDDGLDMENRALYMTITIQRWLALRLDLLGNLIILGIGLFAAGFRHSVNPAKIGVVLSYALSTELVSKFAETEQNMNSVERLLYYAQLPQEGNSLDKKEPPADWPQDGRISLSNVKLAYRENLPLALKGVTLNIRPREKIGIVGRTGAGKSSLVHALLRTVELKEGFVEIDDLDIKEIDLDILRRRVALVPQDNILFLGTLRENIDPEHLRTDAELIEILQKTHLLPSKGASNPTAEAKFSLDSEVSDEGSNFSVGEKQLLALCRCLVKNSKIIILDEATSSIDAETDAKIQRTIRAELSSSTLVCIAHRLHTIAYYDRIVVMSDGKVAEFDTVLNLFDKPNSIFRSLCDQASLTRSDIEKLRAEDY
ncbi:multidrug resistance-associated ABC transporter [Cyathus striatus]|nr:multidrug resistance-associated ABC transporter [Cyathus striatus]